MDQFEVLKPKYPEGAPEYDAYAKALREELDKFRNSEPPYDDFNLPYPTELDSLPSIW